jgi:hypothetical protein
MPYVALVGPEIEENLSLRYIASSLAQPAVGEGEWHMQHSNPDAGGPNSGNMGYGVVDPMPEPSRNRGCGCRKNEP